MPQLGDTQQINGVLYEYGIQSGSIPRWIPRRTSNENAEGPGISSDAGNLLALGSDGLPFFAEVTPFNSSIPEVSNGAGANTGNISTTFIPTETRDYVFEYSGDVQQGGGGISVGTTALGTDLFVASPATGDTDGSRLTITRQENFTPPIPLTSGVTYHITQWAGGGGVIFNHTVSVQGQSSEFVDWIKEECFNEAGDPINLNNFSFLDEISPAQFATLPVTPHMRWTAPSPTCLLYTSPSPRDRTRSRMPSSA